MAREKDLELLLQGAEVWNERREAEPGWRPDLRNAVLRERDLSGIDLRQADLGGADLTGARLIDADLYKAELNRALLVRADLTQCTLVSAVLTEADLGSAVLRNANLLAAQLAQCRLVGADLTRADLGWANLNRTDLTDARLHEAVLMEAVFHRTVLTGTDFANALIGSTIFASVDLRGSRGLDRARFRNPSELTLSTFFLSRGEIPEALLRGAEVPTDFVDHNRALFGRAGEYYSCFISYSRQDRDFAHRLDGDLQALGIRTWLDDHQVLPGDNLYEVIDRGIRMWDKVLLCCSQSSLNSRWVGVEVEKALAKEERLWQERGRRVLALIPLDLDGYLFAWKDARASELSSRFAPDFSGFKENEAKYQQQLTRLVRALRADAGGREEPPEGRL